LNDEDKEKLRGYDRQLSLLCQKFDENLLNATNEYELHITDEKDLSGLPERVRGTARQEAIARNKDGWVFTLHAPSYVPFIQYADSSELRKKMLIASGSRATGGKYDNKQVVLDIINLRKKRANLLGYKSHADFVLADRMVQSQKNLEAFFNGIYEVVKPLAKKDFEALVSCKAKTDKSPLALWDVYYYEEKIKKEQFDFDEEAVRPYFELESVISGLFEHTRLLYGIVFSERKDIPVYQKDVRVFEAKKETGEYLGLLYLDLFPRESKGGGGWIDALRMEQNKDGVNLKTQLLIVCNFTKPETGSPSLLSFIEVETLFHEVGHGLHHLLSECQYPSLSGTNVYRDFVELPSQLLDSWAGEKESLLIFAKHYKTGEPISDDLIKKIGLNKNFFSAWGMLSSLVAAIIDKRLHEESADTITDIEGFEAEIKKHYGFFEPLVGTSFPTVFKHIISSGYDVGYYSYQWAEVLAADAFEYFKENGLFSKEIAEKFRANVLSKGNTEEPLELYRAFRGRDADPKALFRHKGLI
jgi:peptidyl-dipeptidase Dcp